ncbi:peroxiredoxin-like family protein [Robiginitomaculum antarcticum]|uniref:peroxiredoxin-like family protein n=1 Tax=Robiginitomaculum antarcticum TaxID=437507 RepID=UPI00037733EA|nr:peroxiredoxin-like family protein [Robiginitomaculum antarcticum]
MSNLLNPKSQVPEISLPLVGGGEFTLSEAQADNFHILVFYRGVHCPKCQEQLKEIDAEYNDMAVDGFNVVAISMDSEERAEKAKKEWGVKNLPIAYDLDITSAKEFGLFISDAISDSEPDHFSEPGIFVVRPDGTLYAQYIQTSPFGRIPTKQLHNGLKFVVENDYPERGTSTV